MLFAPERAAAEILRRAAMDDAAVHEAYEFLAAYEPFDSLDPDRLRTLSAGVELACFRAGECPVIEDGMPSTHLYVIRTGAAELVHETEVIDVLEPGQSFGHTSLLTGMAPTFTVRARMDTSCYLLDLDQAMIVLGSPAGVRWVALAARNRLARTGHTVHKPRGR
jgi:CBS domain-containing protein